MSNSGSLSGIAGGLPAISQRLHRVMENHLPGQQMDIYQTMDALEARLRKPKMGLAVVVMVAATSEDLGRLVAMADYLDDLRMILLLPDRKTETIARGHKLRPRFLCYVDADFSDVVAVLNKMLGTEPVYLR